MYFSSCVFVEDFHIHHNFSYLATQNGNDVCKFREIYALEVQYNISRLKQSTNMKRTSSNIANTQWQGHKDPNKS